MKINALAAQALGLAAVLMLFSATGATAAPSAEVFGNLPAMSLPSISPDGTHLAAVEPVNGRPVIFVFALDAPPGTAPKSFAAPDALPVAITWVSNDRLVGLFSAEKIKDQGTSLRLRRFVRAVSISLSGAQPIILMKGSRAFSMTSGNTDFLGLDPAGGDQVLMGAYDITGHETTDTHFSQPGYSYNLYSVNADTGDFRAVERGSDKTQSWLVGSKGQAVARLDGDHDLTGDLYLNDGNSWHKALTIDESGGFDVVPVAISADDLTMLAERYGNSGTIELDTFPVSGSTFGPTLFADPTYDIDHEIADPWNGTVVGVAYSADKMEFKYFQPDLSGVQKSLEKALPGETVQIESWDKTRSHFIVATETPREPRIYNLFSTATGQLNPLASEYPSLTAADLGEMKPYNYAARDGLGIHAYLTLPPGRPAKSLPTVIFPHGGPESRDNLSFDWWAQFMATRGYAVLQPNFRGSSGYGAAFEKAGHDQWGKKMQDDISDGVKKLIADGIADPKRICIVGASYGGYAALAGATFSPDLYACAVSFAGIADVPALIGNTAINTGSDSPAVAYWESRIGSRYGDHAFLDEISPAKHADMVRAPILLLHCTNDLTVPIGQSQTEQDALQKAGKKVDFVTIEGDDHYLRVASTRVRVLQEIEKFLAANIGN